MDNIKPWQIILFVAAIGVLGFSVWKFTAGSSLEAQMADSMIMVDVETGQLYEYSIEGQRGVLIPGRHPDTRKLSLLPVFEENGEWYLYERYRSTLGDLDVAPDAVPSADGPVRTNGEDPIRPN
jgi:hypothetical protein